MQQAIRKSTKVHAVLSFSRAHLLWCLQGGPTKALITDSIQSAFSEEAPVGEVTFVFTDVQNSTRLWEAAPNAMNKV